MGWTTRRSNPEKWKTIGCSQKRQDRLWSPPSFLFKWDLGYFLGGIGSGRNVIVITELHLVRKLRDSGEVFNPALWLHAVDSGNFSIFAISTHALRYIVFSTGSAGLKFL